MLAAWTIIFGLAGCASMAAPDPKDLPVVFTAAADLNPRPGGSPQSVDLLIVQLTSADKFRSTDLLAMYPQADKLRTALAETLVSSNRLQLGAGATNTLNLVLEPTTRFVAVIAAYEQYHRAVWRSDVQVRDESQKDPLLYRNRQLTVAVDSLSVSATLE